MKLREKLENCIYDIVIIDNATNRLILKATRILIFVRFFRTNF